MAKHPRPRGTCPVCHREIAGRFVRGELILRAHKRAAAGTRLSGWGPAADCAGAGSAAVRRTGVSEPDQAPFRADRDRAERTGTWPESWGPYHRHFGSDAVHRDGGPECDQPGTPRRVYVFDPDALDEHEAAVAAWAVERYRAQENTLPGQ